MLENLSVQNIALIDNLFVEFEKGLNVLTGETGAGKSILIGALTILLGGKVSSDIIRNGEQEASVAGSFFIDKNHTKAMLWLEAHGIQCEENRVLIRRTLKQNGRSSIWIENKAVTRNELEDFTSFLVDIHGQHDHQSLFRVSEHRRFLDNFAGIENEVRTFTKLYALLAEKREALQNLKISDKVIEEEKELLNFAINEIKQAALKNGEQEELETEEKKLNQFEKLFDNINQACLIFSNEKGIISLVKKALHNIESGALNDIKLEEYVKRLEAEYYELDDISCSLESYRTLLVFDPVRLEYIQNRLSLIYKLTKKYGNCIKDVIEYAEKAEEKLDQLANQENERIELENEISILESKIIKLGRSISEKRKEASTKLQKYVENVLANLGMNKTKFEVRVDTRTLQNNQQPASPYGFDDIEFMISANIGEPLKPLAKIASGGELSRVMLALKTVLAESDEADTLIFDEIDTGIGGEVAVNIASHMKKLSQKKQILCITHLAVIACHADNHIKIEKNTIGQITRTSAISVLDNARHEEIARMLSGDALSEASIKHAQELLLKYAR